MKKLDHAVGVFYMGAVGLFAAVVAVGLLVEGGVKATGWVGGKIEEWKIARAQKKAVQEEVTPRRK